MLFAWALPLAVYVRPQQCIQHRWFGLRFERFETGVVGAVMVSCVQCTCWGEDACRAMSDIRGIDSCRSTSEAPHRVHMPRGEGSTRAQLGGGGFPACFWGCTARQVSLLACGGVTSCTPALMIEGRMYTWLCRHRLPSQLGGAQLPPVLAIQCRYIPYFSCRPVHAVCLWSPC